MKKYVLVLVAALGFMFVFKASAADTTKVAANTPTKECKWSDTAKLKTHMETHVAKYPATGKEIKETCKKEAPNEFSEKERACFETKFDDNKTYDLKQALAALSIK